MKANYRYLYKGDYAIRVLNGAIDYVTISDKGCIISSEPFDKEAHDKIARLFEKELKDIIC